MRVIKNLVFVTWIVAITALSVIPYSKNGIASLKLTESGMVLHFVGYFVASSLCYWAYRKDYSFLYSVFMFLNLFVQCCFGDCPALSALQDL